MTPPRLSRVLAYWLAALAVALLVVGVFTQDRYEPPAPVIEGLVLDGGQVTTTVPRSSAGRPVGKIPHRGVEEEEEQCRC